jgi:hypothetical protein
MELIKKTKPMWDVLLDKYFAPATTIASNVGDFTFPPTEDLVQQLTSTYTMARVDMFENGPTFSAYNVDYNIGGIKGNAIYKTTVTTYPEFCMFDTVEEYEMSFELNY